jgi:hypothetical protein
MSAYPEKSSQILTTGPRNGEYLTCEIASNLAASTRPRSQILTNEQNHVFWLCQIRKIFPKRTSSGTTRHMCHVEMVIHSSVSPIVTNSSRMGTETSQMITISSQMNTQTSQLRTAPSANHLIYDGKFEHRACLEGFKKVIRTF